MKNAFHLTNVYSPSSRNRLPSAAISSDVPLKGAIGSMLVRSRTSSTIPNRPMLRTAPTLGCLAATCSRWTLSRSPMRAARSMSFSSSYTAIVASAVAQARGCEL